MVPACRCRARISVTNAARPAGLPKGALPLWTLRPSPGGRDAGGKPPCFPASRVGACIGIKGALRRHPCPVPALRSGLRPPVPPLTPIPASSDTAVVLDLRSRHQMKNPAQGRVGLFGGRLWHGEGRRNPRGNRVTSPGVQSVTKWCERECDSDRDGNAEDDVGSFGVHGCEVM